MSVPSSRLFLGLIPWYGVLIVLGAGLAILLAERESKRLAFPPDTIVDLALRILPIGILGARIYYVVFSWPSFRSDPLSVLYLWEGGLAIYGGLIAGFMTVVIFAHRRKLSLLGLLDVLVPGVALAQAIGRWGNYFNQEAYGVPLPDSSPFSFFPLAVQIQENGVLVWHAAAFFLESCWDFLIFCFLMTARRKLFRKRGDVFLFYLLLYAAGRLVIENLRMDSLYLGSEVRISQLFSVLLEACVILIFLRRRRKAAGSLSVPLMLLCCAAGILTAALLISCFPSLLFSFPSISCRMVFLSGSSGFLTVTAFLLYGGSAPSEVLYAHHKDP